MIDWDYSELSVTTQCGLLGLPRSTLYYAARPETELNIGLMKVIDEVWKNQYGCFVFIAADRTSKNDGVIAPVCAMSK